LGATAPSSAFAFPAGQAISRTTYATLFSIMSTTYGAGDGSTTFNLPDKTGRVSAMKEASATRLTSTYFVGNSTTMGAVGGLESVTAVTANLPPYTPTGIPSITIQGSYYVAGAATSSSAAFGVNNGGPGSLAGSIIMDPQGGTSTPMKNVQPTIVCNYILRII
jgi:microcystin-dependent protein